MAERMLAAASVLVAVGGLLTIITGVVSWVQAATVSANITNYGEFEAAYILSILAGVALILLAVGFWVVHSLTGVGVAAAIVSALTLYVGLGFLPAVLLCVAGGLLAALHDSFEELFAQGMSMRAGPGAPHGSSPAQTIPGRTCPACGSAVSVAAVRCPECGALLGSNP
jgi:hypothetical protein